VEEPAVAFVAVPGSARHPQTPVILSGFIAKDPCEFSPPTQPPKDLLLPLPHKPSFRPDTERSEVAVEEPAVAGAVAFSEAFSPRTGGSSGLQAAKWASANTGLQPPRHPAAIAFLEEPGSASHLTLAMVVNAQGWRRQTRESPFEICYIY
jgi:hypothetical protein